ncbi:hydroxymethylglutaryl-CoA lyase [Azoarcus indigens]|uniref:hydroxymethylglutaryl-CoA lyase n=1 Tax=Azoarcus indigens TaxID=29545 RepID=A0A4R6EC98_9RHOO|nr:hydroxymethylglutaryl-CoA lyase [Azoarcus indigens]NMG64166.1 hydroxymethylglutaryl-CoA lyase [Azoarcus indigens]TDN55761.1 hydroxymethylglutaryl-CoA lyase [Azoarcus indigens]
MKLPAQVRIVEVGPRDGLQNERQPIAIADKLMLIRRLQDAGLRSIEVAAFVSPKWVPQMADAAAVLAGVLAESRPGVGYAVLVPNLRGLEAALAAGATEVAVFAAASERFSQRNINCSIAESLQRFKPVVERARQAQVRVRGYVSCAAGCPYEGEIAPAAVVAVASALAGMGCEEISLGDTTGVGNPASISRMLEAVMRHLPPQRLAGHYHDTYGMAAANVYASLQLGIATFDASVAGLGGCPYAPGAAGNVATEDLVWLLHGLGIATGLDLDRLVDTAAWISRLLGREPFSRVTRALRATPAGPR